MPLLSTRCLSCATVTDYLSPKEPRPEACPVCGGSMADALTAPASGRVTGSNNPVTSASTRYDDRETGGFRVLEETDTLIIRQKGTDTGVWVEWQCPAGHKGGDIYDVTPATTPACSDCGAETTRIIGVPQVDWFTAAGYHATGGYQDDVLGCWVRSPEHRREILAGMGLVEGGPDSAALLRQAERQAEIEAEDREVADMLRVQLPDDANTREMRAKGLIPDEEWAKTDLATEYGWKF